MRDNSNEDSSFLRLALAESERRGEPFIGPAHLLIAAAQAGPLKARKIEADALREAIADLLGTPVASASPRLMIGPTKNAARILERAAGIARTHDRTASADDLLLALLEDAEHAPNEASIILVQLGLSLDALRRELL